MRGMIVLKKSLLRYLICSLLMILTLSTFVTASAGVNRMKVAVLPFDVQASLDTPGEVFSDSLVDSLIKLDNYDLVERSQLKKVLEQQKLSATGLIDEKSKVLEIGQLTGANWIITGNVTRVGSKFITNCKVIDAQNAKILQSGKLVTDKIEDFILQVDPFAYKLVNGETTPILTPLYSWVNQGTGNTYLSTNPAGEGIAAQGFDSRGIIGYISKTQAPQTIPLYRIRHQKTGDYLYTSNQTFGDATHKATDFAKQYGYVDQLVIGYLVWEQKNNTTPLYRFRNIKTGFHFYTSDINDPLNKIIEFTSEGQEGYIWKSL